jgi:phospholipase A1
LSYAAALRRCAAAALAAAASCPAGGAADAASCAAIDDDRARLACYDAVHRRPVAPATASAPVSSTSWLAEVWELDAASKQGIFQLRPHGANYFLPLRASDQPNTMPSSPAPDRTVATPLPLDSIEAKFQLSLKVKLVEGLLRDSGDLWFAFTQQSNWQLYESAFSSPFRENDYLPELIVSWPMNRELLGWRWELLNLGFAHQSNGRGKPLSRSWNRVYAQFGFSRGAFTLLAKPWLRLPEDDDDNPDIGDYMGPGEVRFVYRRGGHVYSLLGRYAGDGRGFAGIDWAFPAAGNLHGYLQFTSGYGETLIDYNHSQTTIGIGVLLLPWR